MKPLTLSLLKAAGRLVTRLQALEEQLDAGDRSVWAEYTDVIRALAALAPLTTPEARGALLTTEQLAERLQVSSKTVLRRAQRGELHPVRLAARGRGALRWTGGAGR